MENRQTTTQEFKGDKTSFRLFWMETRSVYREYGFAQVLVQEYKSRRGAGLPSRYFR